MSENLPTWLRSFATSDYFIGAASLLLLIFLIKIFFKKGGIEVFSSKFGRVRVSRRALYAVIYGITDSVEGVTGRGIKFKIRRKKICINVRIKLNICCNISSLSEDLQMRLNNVLANDLGLNVGEINVVISGFSRQSYRRNDLAVENCCESKRESSADETD